MLLKVPKSKKCSDVLELSPSSVECSLSIEPCFLVFNLKFESCFVHARANFK